jgi:hypothetical protein
MASGIKGEGRVRHVRHASPGAMFAGPMHAYLHFICSLACCVSRTIQFFREGLGLPVTVASDAFAEVAAGTTTIALKASDRLVYRLSPSLSNPSPETPVRSTCIPLQLTTKESSHCIGACHSAATCTTGYSPFLNFEIDDMDMTIVSLCLPCCQIMGWGKLVKF